MMYRYHVSVSGTGIKCRYQVSVSGIGIRHRYHVSVSGIGVKCRYQVLYLYQVSSIGLRHQVTSIARSL